MLVFSSSDSTTAPGAPKSVNMFDGRVHGLALSEERMPQNSATVHCRGEYKVSVSEVPLSTYLAIVAAVRGWSVHRLGTHRSWSKRVMDTVEEEMSVSLCDFCVGGRPAVSEAHCDHCFALVGRKGPILLVVVTPKSTDSCVVGMKGCVWRRGSVFVYARRQNYANCGKRSCSCCSSKKQVR